MGKAKGGSPTCVRGNPIAKELKPDRPEFLRNGYCHGCGDGPLHSPHNDCGCSVIRGSFRLCRECAVGFDYLANGHTRLEPAPFTQEEWRDFERIHDRGHRALKGMADVATSVRSE